MCRRSYLDHLMTILSDSVDTRAFQAVRRRDVQGKQDMMGHLLATVATLFR